MSRVLLAASAACALVFSAGATTYFWTYNGEGDWSDGSKWHKGSTAGATGEVPGEGDIAEVSLPATNCTINVDGNYTVAEFMTDWGQAAKPIVCTLKGTGKLTVTNPGASGSPTTLQVNTWSTLILDGPDVYCVGTSVQYCEGGALIVKEGSTYTPWTHYIKTAPGRLVIDGGTVTSEGNASRSVVMQNGWSSTGDPLGFIDLKAGLLDAKTSLHVGTFTMTGGTWDRSPFSNQGILSDLCQRENLTIDIQGGDAIIFSATDTTPFPPNKSFYNVRNLASAKSADATWRIVEEDGGEQTFGAYDVPLSTLVVTNDCALHGERLNLGNLAFHTGAHDVVLDVSDICFNLTDSTLYPFATITTSQQEPDFLPLHVTTPGPTRISSAGSKFLKILASLNQYYTDCRWNIGKELSISTTDAKTGTEAVDFYIGCPLFEQDSALAVDGLGTTTISFNTYTNATSRTRSCQDGLSNRLARVSVTGGATLKLENMAWLNRDNAFRTDKLVLGANAKLQTINATYAHVEALEAELDPTSELVFTTPDTSSSSWFAPAPLTLGPKHVNDAMHPTVTFGTSGAAALWNFAWINGQPTLWYKDKDPHVTTRDENEAISKWRGTKSADFADEANWLLDAGKSLHENPLKQRRFFDGGYENTRVTVNGTVQAYQIRAYNNTAPLAFVGTGAIEFGCNGRNNQAASEWSVNCAIVTTSENPLIFDVPVKLSDSVVSDRDFTVCSGSRSYVAFLKDVGGTSTFTVKGDILVGGTLTADNLLFNEQGSAFPARRTRLAVLPGGNVTATRQTWLQSGKDVQVDVYSNATFMVACPSADCFWGCNVERRPIAIRRGGRFDCRAPLGGSTAVAFRGEGEVRLADTGSKATADYPVTLDGVTFAVDAFASGHPLVFKGSPTWASKADWTYTLAPVLMSAGETLTVDTGDLDDVAVGHSVAINTPVTADRLVKKGVGTLTLGSPGNAIGVLDVSAGALRLGAAQTVGSVAFAEGATLEIAEGLAAAGVWTTVLTLPKDADATVLPDLGQNYRVRLVETDTAIQLQAKPVSGTILLLR